MANYLPGYDDPEMQDISRQRKFAEILRQQSTEPLQGSMVSGHYIAPSVTQGLAKMLQSYQAGQLEKDATAKRQALDDDAMNAMTEYAKTAQTDPSGAMQILAQSKSPMVRQMYLAQALRNVGPKEYGTDPRYDQNGHAFLVGKDGSMKYLDGVQAREKVDIAPNGVTYNPFATPAGTVFGDPNKPFNIGAGGAPVPNLPYQKFEMGKSRAGATNVSVTQAGPKAFDTAMGGSDAELIKDYRTKADAARESLALVKNLRDSIAKGVYSGGGAEAKTAAANMINGLTGITPENLEGSQEFQAEAAKLVLEKIKTLGANPSNADREFIERTVPNLTKSPEARDQLINFVEQKAQQAISLHKSADAYGRSHSGLGGWEPPAAVNDIHSQADAILRGVK